MGVTDYFQKKKEVHVFVEGQEAAILETNSDKKWFKPKTGHVLAERKSSVLAAAATVDPSVATTRRTGSLLKDLDPKKLKANPLFPSINRVDLNFRVCGDCNGEGFTTKAHPAAARLPTRAGKKLKKIPCRTCVGGKTLVYIPEDRSLVVHRAQKCKYCLGEGRICLESRPMQESSQLDHSRCFNCVTCSHCQGSGIFCQENTRVERFERAVINCPRCAATGFIHDTCGMPHEKKSMSERCFFCKDCTVCSGLGTISTARREPGDAFSQEDNVYGPRNWDHEIDLSPVDSPHSGELPPLIAKTPQEPLERRGDHLSFKMPTAFLEKEDRNTSDRGCYACHGKGYVHHLATLHLGDKEARCFFCQDCSCLKPKPQMESIRSHDSDECRSDADSEYAMSV